ncbi:HAD-IB family phosphatase [Solitalea canadensis]|uniref:D-3-phosphoglycerate dehydrogenase n=1 Tax=Solitalea canadensis (strain ATCC 29591 / DSM 3403 / JCM 21819 / LMG 8368 / NBRC 15130 / NCIMB 12057 / USAM 9D) TaxID=929556 RepID=H8KMP2_SOLCM|nr:HAD-IB family phosphatase [Solitalea canadensis]AFD09033.1 haloacid dehalogenase superfamily protein, subfamily IB, phosphoserine phosphatase [Solitalea canadensis DSM 3403]
MKNRYIIDFDSTFTQVEALDELVKISLKGHPDKDKVLKQIEDYTNAAMEGRMSFTDSLRERVKLLGANSEHLQKLVKVLKKKVSSSFSRNRKFFEKHADEVFIVSGGFKEFITPVVSDYKIKSENIYANTFEFNEQGTIIGYDITNPLSQEGGKVKLLKQLNWEGNLYGIGDGYSDFQLKESGLIKKFFAYTENIERSNVVKNADHVLPSFDEFLYVNNLPMAISYPKNRILCLCIGDIHEESLSILKKDGFSIRHKTSFEEKYVADVGMLLLGNGVTVENEKLSRAITLKTIGCLGSAKDKIDLNLCTRMGMVVFDDRKSNPRNSEFIPKRMADFINKGSSYLSCNFPNIQLLKQEKAHRLIHIHHNVPGIMAQINSVMADHDINILAQYLKTNDQIGYVITDVNTEYDKKVIKALKKIEHTIKFRLLY